MCGIIGYVGSKIASNIILDGLSDLEYRGYDSSGISLFSCDGELDRYRASGKLINLKRMKGLAQHSGTIGIGHTRWATHGAPTEQNAHPHQDCNSKISVVHNGIIENFEDLKSRLTAGGHIFESETDAEVIPHYIEAKMNDGLTLEEAVVFVIKALKGSNSALVLHRDYPDQLVAFRSGNAGGMVVGYGNGGMFISSDVLALSRHTSKISHMNSGEIAIISANKIRYMDFGLHPLDKEIEKIEGAVDGVTRGEYPHYMLKEIYDQPESLRRLISKKIANDSDGVASIKTILSQNDSRRINRIVILGMGTSYNAAVIGRRYFEDLAKIPSEADNSSEFRYRDPLIDERTLVVSISQSGETADTISAMETAALKKCYQVTLCNRIGSQASRMADITLSIDAGQEIGVAATKTFTNTLVCLYLFATSLGFQRGVLDNSEVDRLIKDVSSLPITMQRVLDNSSVCIDISKKFSTFDNFLYLGRGLNYPIAMEGALKLKEISYIHAEGYPAGEMKHGPISLIDESMPVVALIPSDTMHSKMLSNINEAKARKGIVISIANDEDGTIEDKVDHVIRVPETTELLTPIVNSIPLQLLAYYIAVQRDCSVDQPRNLAKSVTVE